MTTHPDPLLDDPVANVDVPRLRRGLARILAPDQILWQREAKAPFESDGLAIYRGDPLVVVLPADVQECAAILKLAAASNAPVVTRGAGTGLSAGALPLAHGILLVLTKLDRILNIDPLARTATVEPGVRNLALTERAAAYGLTYAPDPSSEIACSIGGNVAENAGGVHCLKYGLTGHNIVALTLLTMDGETVTLGAGGLDAPGFDLMALVTGSEGLMGVITSITVRLVARPADTLVLLAGFATIDAACDSVNGIFAAGIVPAGLEMMDALAVQAAEDFAQAGYPRDAAAILLIELDGDSDDIAEDAAKVDTVLQAAGATSLRRATDAQERALLWKGRKSAFPAMGRLAPDYYCMDGTIPRQALADVLKFIRRLGVETGLQVANVFHAGDGNLHPLILFDANEAGAIERVEAMGGRILEKCLEVGGTITGEHGVGREKINQMAAQFTDAEISQLHALKAAFDPARLLNPGKAVPSLRRCQEYRSLPQSRPGA